MCMNILLNMPLRLNYGYSSGVADVGRVSGRVS